MVITPWPDEPSEMERSNRDDDRDARRRARGDLQETTPDGLASAGAALPLDELIG